MAATPEKPETESEKVGKLVVKKVPELEETTLSTLWQDQAVVITFFRRFGCIFCRQSAKEMSSLQPLLDKHDVKLVGVGMDEAGLEEFVKGKYFTGELFLDPSKDTYKALGYKRLNYFNILTSFFSKASRDAYNKSRSENIGGNFKGDSLQNGGTLVIKKGGEVLLSYKAENPADHVGAQEVLNALGITDPIPEVTPAATTNGHPETNGTTPADPEDAEPPKSEESPENKPAAATTNGEPQPVS